MRPPPTGCAQECFQSVSRCNEVAGTSQLRATTSSNPPWPPCLLAPQRELCQRALMTMTHSASMHESLSPIRWCDAHIVFLRSLPACRPTCGLGRRSVQAPEPISKNGSRCWNQKTQLYDLKVPEFFSDPHLFLPHTTITKKQKARRRGW